MPKGYEEIRDRFISQGMDAADAKTHAARIWNSTHKGSKSVNGSK